MGEQRNLVVSVGGVGVATLVAGTVNVPFPNLTANSVIIPAPQNVSGTAGNLSFVKTPGVGFDINSDNAADTRDIAYLITEPV